MLKKALFLLPCLFTIVLAGWAPEEQITTDRTGKDLRMNNGRKVVVAANGVRHMVWHGLYYSRYYPSSGWTNGYLLSKKGGYPSIALDPNGTDIHVVWQSGYSIYYQKCVPGSSGTGGWVGKEVIGPRPSGTYFQAPSVACYIDANDVYHIVVAWFTWIGDPNVIWFCECIDGNWGQPIAFENPPGWQFAWQPSVAVDPQGRQGEVFLLMHVDDGSLYAKRRVNGVWQPWENVGASGGNDFIDVDPGTGCPHIVFNAAGIYHTYRDPSGGWQPVEKISGEDALENRWPSMAFSDGSAFVVWPETTSTAGGVRYTIGQYGNWTSPDWLTSRYLQFDLNLISTAASPNGDVYTVYMDEAGRYTQLFGRLYTPDGERAQATNEGSLGNKVKADLLNLTIAPNPAIDLATVRYSVQVVGPVTLKLYDVIGREITTLAQGTHEPGRYNINLDTHTLAQGIYYLKYESGNYHEIKKLIIQR